MMICRNWKLAIQHLEQHATEVVHKSSAFWVHYWGYAELHYNNPVHKHSFFEICYVMDGTGTYWEEEKSYPLQKGTFFCSRPQKTHQILSDTGLHMMWVAFEVIEERTHPAINSMFKQLCHMDHFFIDSEAMGEESTFLWKALFKICGKQSFMMDSMRSSAHALLIGFPGTFGIMPEQSAVIKSDTAQHVSLLRQAKLYVQDNLSQPLLLEEVASYLHISGRHLSRLMKRETGRSYSQIIRHERMTRAAQLLIETDITIQDIATQTGFDTVHYFTRVFTRHHGIPPGAYRKGK